jgi:hypothetical protein
MVKIGKTADCSISTDHLLHARGICSIRAKAANLKGLSHLMKWVIDTPADNL